MSQDCGDVKKVFVKNNSTSNNTKVVKGIQISDLASQKLLNFLESEGKSPKEYCLFISVSKDGCSGFSYQMELEPILKCEKQGAKRFEKNQAIFMIAKTSYFYLVGSILDYKEALTGSGFTLTNPNAKKYCSCGASFSVK
ncbi:MAG: iron-sulfur cluster assembly accessory protein [bacterium]